MNSDTYQNKKGVTAGESNSKSEEMDTVKISIVYQHSFLIVAGSLLTLLVLVTIAGHSGGDGGSQYLTSTAEVTKGSAGALSGYQVDTTNSALANDIFGFGVVSENNEGKI